MTEAEMIEELEQLGFSRGKKSPDVFLWIDKCRTKNLWIHVAPSIRFRGRIGVFTWYVKDRTRYFWRRKSAINYIKRVMERMKNE